MPNFAAVTRHVDYWRGVIHRWSCVYPYTGTASLSGTTAVDAIHAIEDDILYGTGGIFQVDLYDLAAKGSPVETKTYFDWSVPGDWINPNGGAWSVNNASDPETVREVAMKIDFPAGLSKSGKPVFFRKWYHAVPKSLAADGAVDIVTGDRSTLSSQADSFYSALDSHGLTFGNSGRIAPRTTPVVDGYYCNHQMPKGRKRKPLV